MKINYIEIHGSIEYLKFLRRFCIKRKPSQPNENKIQQNKKDIKSSINFITPDNFPPIPKDSEIQKYNIEKNKGQEDDKKYVQTIKNEMIGYNWRF